LLGGAALHEQLKRMSPSSVTHNDNCSTDRVLLLVRARDHEHAIQRVADQLSAVCALEQRPRNPRRLTDWIRQLVEKGALALITGDLRPLASAHEPSWRDDQRLQGVTHVLDVAASTYFSESRYDSESTRHGSHQLLHALLRARAPLARFVHCGTAWSAVAASDSTPSGQVVVDEIDARSVPADVRHLVPYALDKLGAERALVADAARFSVPLVVARPSICLGHTRHGCAVTQSIFWAVRLAALMRTLPFDVRHTWFDFVPIDWTARALLAIGFDIEQPRHALYHLSAGRSGALLWSDLISTIRNSNNSNGGGDASLPERVSAAEFDEQLRSAALSPEALQAIGAGGDVRTVLRGFRYYVPFAQASVVFDNRRLLSESEIERLPDMQEFVRLCNNTYGDFNNKDSQQEDI